MSYTKAEEAPCAAHDGNIALLIEPRVADLGEFSVRRALPSRERRMVGPFVFFDHMGPAEFPPGAVSCIRSGQGKISTRLPACTAFNPGSRCP